jgi:hypothetical protein
VLGHSWQWSDAVFGIDWAEIPDLFIQIPLPLGGKTTWANKWWELGGYWRPRRGFGDGEPSFFRVSVLLYEDRTGEITCEAKMVVFSWGTFFKWEENSFFQS